MLKGYHKAQPKKKAYPKKREQSKYTSNYSSHTALSKSLGEVPFTTDYSLKMS